METKKNFSRHLIIIIIALAMIFTFTPAAGIIAYADNEAASEITDQDDNTGFEDPQAGDNSEVQEELPSSDESDNDGEGNEVNEAPSVQESDTVEEPVTEETAKLNVSAKAYSGTYDGTYHKITLNGVPEGATVEYHTEGSDWSDKASSRKNAGSTKVYYRVTDESGQVAQGTSMITVKKAPLKSAKLSKTTYVFNNKKQAPAIKLSAANGLKLVKNTDYTVKVSGNSKSVGSYKITISGKGNYSGTLTKSYTIKPKKAALKTASLAYNSLNVKTKANASTYGGGYFQIAYKKAGGSWKIVTARSASKALSVANAKTYYVKVRAVKKVGSKTYAGDWSAQTTVKNRVSTKVQRVLHSSRTTAYAGQGRCAAWVCNVFDRSGILTSARMPYASDYYRAYCYSSDKAELKPGMIVASKYSYNGGYAGHIGIYIGNGKVISNEGSINVKSLSTFCSQYSHGAPVKWGWMNNKKLI